MTQLRHLHYYPRLLTHQTTFLYCPIDHLTRQLHNQDEEKRGQGVPCCNPLEFSKKPAGLPFKRTENMYEEIHVGPSPKFLSKPKSPLQIKETIPIDIIIRLLQVQLRNDPLDLLQTFKSRTSFAIKSKSIIYLPQKNFVNLIVDYPIPS